MYPGVEMGHPETDIRVVGRGLVRYDSRRRRVWVCGQRLHHGLTGVFLAGAGMALMVHDWQDRSIWFARGRQH
jgi:hypothetical protein